MPNDKVKSYLHLHFIVFVWGFTAVLGKKISLPALSLVWFRMSLAVLFMLVYVALMRIRMRVPLQTVAAFLVAGFVIALHWLTFFQAIKVSNVSVTLACLSTGAFFTAFLEPIFMKRKVVWYEIVFGLLVIGGLCIIFQVESRFWEGILLALTSAFLSATFSIVNGAFASRFNAAVISVYEIIGGILLLTVWLAVTESFGPGFFDLSLSDWTYLAILSSVCTAYAFIASVQVMRHLTPYTVMLTINLEPVYGILLAIIWLKGDEKMRWEFYLGAAIILATVVMNGILKTRARRIATTSDSSGNGIES